MIPSIFCTGREKEAEDALAETVRLGQKEGASVLGFAGAIAAYRDFLIP